eukprot:403341672
MPIVDEQNREMAKLTTVDGKEYEIPILTGSMGEKHLDIRALYTQTNMFFFDPGYTVTGSCASSISYSNSKGKLLYRGYSIEELCQKSTYIEVCFLLLYGELPNAKELDIFEERIKDEMIIHDKLLDFYKGFTVDSHPMAIMCSVVGALSSFFHNTLDIKDPIQRELSAIKIIGKMPVIAAVAFRTSAGLPIVHPNKKLSYVQNFLHMMFSDPMDPEFQVPKLFVDYFEKIFILHADNDQGPSTTTVRIAGSSLANPFACISAGVASLWGPMHGGANEEQMDIFQDIGSEENIPKFLDQVKRKEKKLMGFGHRIYKSYDPRAKIIKQMCFELYYELGIKDPLFDIALKLEELALKDEYFTSRHLYPNIDYYTGFLLNTLQIPRNMFCVIFAITRSLGWIAQWREMMSEPVTRIGRPRQIYVGEKLREFVQIDNRKDAPGFVIENYL